MGGHVVWPDQPFVPTEATNVHVWVAPSTLGPSIAAFAISGCECVSVSRTDSMLPVGFGIWKLRAFPDEYAGDLFNFHFACSFV